MSLSRNIIVTGANRGIGRAICQTILSRSDLGPVRLFAASRSGEDLAFDQVNAPDHEILYRKLDIANHDSIHAFADSVSSDAGPVDVLINNAGVNLDANYNVENVRKTLDVNFRGTRDMCNAFLPRMRTAASTPSHIVNLSSVASALHFYSPALQQRLRSVDLLLPDLEHIARSYEASVETASEEKEGFGVPVRAYALSKALVTALTRVLARHEPQPGDLPHRSVRVNCCCPGWIATDMGALVGRGRAPKTTSEGALVPVHLAFDADPGINGAYWANESVRGKGVGEVREW